MLGSAKKRGAKRRAGAARRVKEGRVGRSNVNLTRIFLFFGRGRKIHTCTPNGKPYSAAKSHGSVREPKQGLVVSLVTPSHSHTKWWPLVRALHARSRPPLPRGGGETRHTASVAATELQKRLTAALSKRAGEKPGKTGRNVAVALGENIAPTSHSIQTRMRMKRPRYQPKKTPEKRP